MIVGSGMIAHAVCARYAEDDRTLIYAAGVSNSACTDVREFERERRRLQTTLELSHRYDAFVYFGTTSVMNADAAGTAYVRHKVRMEELVRARRGHLIVRLPQLAGMTRNPHTLLNYLAARIARGERFVLWEHARRNILDVDDVAAVLPLLLGPNPSDGLTIDVVNPYDHTAMAIVAALEAVLGKSAVYDLVPRGGASSIEAMRIEPLFERAGVRFGRGYLERVLRKYYG